MPLTPETRLGTYEIVGRRFAEAEVAYRKALELAPQRGGTHAFLALPQLAQSRGDEALVEAARDPETVFRLAALAIVHHALGHGPESDEALRELVATVPEDGAVQIAEVYGSRGEMEAAFDWLERSRIGIQDSPRSRAARSSARSTAIHAGARS